VLQEAEHAVIFSQEKVHVCDRAHLFCTPRKFFILLHSVYRTVQHLLKLESSNDIYAVLLWHCRKISVTCLAIHVFPQKWMENGLELMTNFKFLIIFHLFNQRFQTKGNWRSGVIFVQNKQMQPTFPTSRVISQLLKSSFILSLVIYPSLFINWCFAFASLFGVKSLKTNKLSWKRFLPNK